MTALAWLLLLLLLVAPPLLTAAADTLPIASRLHWPPLAGPLAAPPLSPLLYTLLLATGMAVTVLPLAALLWRRAPARHRDRVERRPLPGWGVAALTLLLVSLAIVANDTRSLDLIRPLLLLPCGLALAILVNALSWRRSGHSLITDQPAYFAMLILLSIGCGLYIEYLNLFLANWFYQGAPAQPGWGWWLLLPLLHATALPLIASLRQWLNGVGWIARSIHPAVPQPAAAHLARWSPWLIVVALLPLAAAGQWPEHAYPLTWLAPLLLLTGWQLMAGGGSLLLPFSRRVVVAAVSGLLYGVFVEGVQQLAPLERVYHLPYLDCCPLLDLPLAGWVAYPLLGMTAAVVIDLIAVPWRGKPATPSRRPFPVKVVVEGQGEAGAPSR